MYTEIYSFQFTLDSNGFYETQFSCLKIPYEWQIMYQYNQTHIFLFLQLYKADQMLFYHALPKALMYAGAVYEIQLHETWTMFVFSHCIWFPRSSWIGWYYILKTKSNFTLLTTEYIFTVFYINQIKYSMSSVNPPQHNTWETTFEK